MEFVGAPIGDTDFEGAFYEAKATAVVSKIIATTEMLHDRSAAAAHTLLYTCLQHQWGCRIRTCRGDASNVSAKARVDEALKHGLLTYSPHARVPRSTDTPPGALERTRHTIPG